MGLKIEIFVLGKAQFCDVLGEAIIFRNANESQACN